MESVYWIARRYEIPFLLIVLNNGGWNAPKVSALLVHKEGLSSKSNRKGKSRRASKQSLEDLLVVDTDKKQKFLDLNISFEPSPDYPGIATAAGKAWGASVVTQNDLDPVLQEATGVVKGGRCAVVEVS